MWYDWPLCTIVPLKQLTVECSTGLGGLLAAVMAALPASNLEWKVQWLALQKSSSNEIKQGRTKEGTMNRDITEMNSDLTKYLSVISITLKSSDTTR